MPTEHYPSVVNMFKQWWELVLDSRFQHWKDIRDDERAECNYAEANDMDSMYWCQACHIGICEDHVHYD